MTAATPALSDAHILQRERAVLGVIAIGHFFSHVFLIAIPALVPVIKADLGIGGVEIGFIAAVYAFFSAIGHYPAGVLVDRFQPRYFIIGALTLVSVAVIFMGVMPFYVPMLIFAAVAGVGDSVFHPADYAILGPAIRPERQGRAFSIHTFSGFFGFAVGPVVVVVVAALWSWPAALILIGVCGLAGAALLIVKRDLLIGEADIAASQAGAAPPAGAPGAEAKTGAVSFLFTPVLLIMFVFYATTAAATNGIQTHGVAALIDLYRIPFAAASAILPSFLWGTAIGVLAGGYLADRYRRFEVTAVVGYLIAIAALVLVAMTVLPFALVIVAFFFAGFVIGGIMPSRDVMVRAVTPPGAMGKSFGFVSSGFMVGATVGPVLFGWVFDRGWLEGIFIGAAILMVFTIAAVLAATRFVPATSRSSVRGV